MTSKSVASSVHDRLVMTAAWLAPDTPWVAKLTRAKHLVDELSTLTEGFVPTAYQLDYERGEHNETHLADKPAN